MLDKAFALQGGLVDIEVSWRREWLVTVVQTMYEDATTVVIVNCRESKAFGVRVGVYPRNVSYRCSPIELCIDYIR